MKNYRKIVKEDLAKLRSSSHTMKDIFDISFSHENMIAYERLNNFHIESVTYKDLKKQIVKFADSLMKNHKPVKGEFIAIDLENGPSFLIAFWGSLMAGYIPYLVNSYYPLSLREALLNRLKINKVITFSNAYPDFEKIDINLTLKNINEEGTFKENWANSFALSSTLTGLEAKIVLYEGESIALEIENSDDIISKNSWFMQDYKGRIKIASILPLFHIFGIMVSYLWFAFFGRTIVFFNNLSEETVRATIIRHGITHIFAPPLLFNKLSDGIEKGLSLESKKKQKAYSKAINLIAKIGDIAPKLSLYLSRKLMKEVRTKAFGESPRFMISGGAYISSTVLKNINGIGYPLFNGYGTTETSITSLNLSLKFSSRIDGSIGKPFKSVTYSLLDNNNLLVKGKSLAKKIIYLNGKEEVINEVLTNDILIYQDDTYFINGRTSDLYISDNGENISPDLIEREINLPLANSFSILELDGKLTLIIQYDEHITPLLIKRELEQLRKELYQISYGKYISNILLTHDNLSSLHAIKVSRKLLKKNIKENKIKFFNIDKLDQKVEDDKDKEDEYMILIKKNFQDCLLKETIINQDSDFFLDLGGDSLGYITLLTTIEETFQVKFDLEKDRNLRTPFDFYSRIKKEAR